MGRIDLRNVPQSERRRVMQEHWKRRLATPEPDELGVTETVPPLPTAPRLPYDSTPRAWDAPAVSPYGEVPPPRASTGEVISEEDADDWQDELNRQAYYELLEREKAQQNAEAELTRPPIDVPLAQPPATQLPATQITAQQPPAAPPPVKSTLDRFKEGLAYLEEQRQKAAPVDSGARLSPDKVFSPEKQMAAAREAYDRETVRRDPENQYYKAAEGRTLEGEDGLDELRLDSQLGQREMRGGPNARSEEQIAELRDKGLFTEPSYARKPVQSSKSPDELPNPYGESDTKWEDEFLKSHDRMTNQQIRRRAAIIGMFGSDAEQKMFTDRETGFASDYDKGLVEARERDRGERRVSREDATALAGSGMVDPETAASLTNRSLPGAAYPNGGYALGRNAQKNDLMWQQFNLGQQGLNARTAQQINAEGQNKDASVAAQVAGADTMAESRQRTQRAQLTHDEHANLFASVANKSFSLPRDIALEAFDGNFARVPPELMTDVENALAQIKPFTAEADLKALGPQMAALGAKIPYSAAKVEADTIARGLADPQFAQKTQDDLLTSGMQLSHGIKAWSQLSEQGKRDFAAFGGKGIGAILANGLKDPHDRALAGSVWTVLNNLIQQRSGVAVTESEWGRTANEIGLAQGVWDPFNTYEGIEIYLDNARDVMQARFGLYQRNFGWK